MNFLKVHSLIITTRIRNRVENESNRIKVHRKIIQVKIITNLNKEIQYIFIPFYTLLQYISFQQ